MTDRVQAPEYLSAEELRNRLYHSLRNRGLVDSIKSQLRNSLVTELQQSVRGPLTLKDLGTPEETSLLHRASNSLVANHLQACQYEYSLSVFLPECGLNQDKKFETTDLLKLLNISPHSRLYQRLGSHSQQDSKKGFLWQLLTEVSSLHANSVSSIGCQTDLIKMGPITPLDEKLSDVDELYSSRREDYLRTGRAGAEERLLSFQRQLEDRYNTQLKMEIARMRDAEISTIKMNEKENARKATEQARRELERVYKDKHDALVTRERNASERLQQQTEIHDRETYAQRQSILEEIEAVRQREAEVKREAEVNVREKKLAEKRVKDKEEDLRRRELEVKQKENSFEQRLQNEMAQFKLDQQARYIERIQNVEVREATLKEQERIVSDEKARLQQVKDELRDKTHRVNELETQISEVRYSEVNANKNNEYLNAKLRDMSDYSTLKEQVVLYRNELETVRTRLAEVLSMNERERGRQEELLRELRRPSPESLMLHRDLERSKEELRQETTVFQQQKQMLEARLKEELDRNRDLVQRFEEQNLQMREMNREVVDLRQSLHMTTKALNNEVYKKSNEDEDGDLNESRHSEATQGQSFSKPPPSSGLHRGPESAAGLARRSGGGGGRGMGPGMRLDFDTKDVYHDVDSDFVSVSQGRDGLFYDDADVSSADSADIIAQAKYRLRSLDKEAHNLERAYHDFHCRVTNPNALSNDEPAQPQSQPKRVTKEPQPGPQKLHVESPRQSPIPFENPQVNPMSSTPYKKQTNRKQQELNDSFTELATHSGKFQPSQDPPDHPRLGLEHVEDTRKVKTRSLTMDDLERRPGSPDIMVVAGSTSSDEGNKPETVRPGPSASATPAEPAPTTTTTTTAAAAVVSTAPSQQTTTALPSAASLAPPSQFSLDAAWKSQLQEEEEREKEARRRQQEMEAELEREQDRQREEAKREEQRRQEEEAAVAKEAAEKEEEEKIDPVMKQYMAMVQQQKEQEKQQSAQKASSRHRTHSRDRTPSQSETEDLSIANDDRSEQDNDW